MGMGVGAGGGRNISNTPGKSEKCNEGAALTVLFAKPETSASIKASISIRLGDLT
jgi:hypothetical protein